MWYIVLVVCNLILFVMCGVLIYRIDKQSIALRNKDLTIGNVESKRDYYKHKFEASERVNDSLTKIGSGIADECNALKSRIAELEAANEKLITERAKIRQAVGVDLPGIDVPEGPKFKVGDKVVVVCGHEHDDYFPTGTIATVCQIDSVEPTICVTSKDEHFTWVYTSDIELAPSEVSK